MELRELRIFITAADELHFARAASRLHMSPSSVTEAVQSLEAELGTALFTRTTRRVALTDAGVELLGRTRLILDLVAETTAAVISAGRGDTGSLRLGVTPPAVPVIAPHLARLHSEVVPDRPVEIVRMWLPALGAALVGGVVDAALTCGELGVGEPDVTTATIGAEPLLVGLRADHFLAGGHLVDLHALAAQTLGLHSANLFPAWHAVQRQILADAGIDPPTAELDETDLTTSRWSNQPEVDWVMLAPSLGAGDSRTVTRPAPPHTVPFTLSWRSQPAVRPGVERFVQTSLEGRLPDGWLPPTRDAGS